MSLVVFDGHRLVAQGEIRAALADACQYAQATPEANLLALHGKTARVLQLDFNLPVEALRQEVALQNGDPPEPVKRGRGRPKLGVVSREVSLLPRHWEWLEMQPGGASAAMRRLIEQARKSPENQIKEARLAVDRALQTLAGDLPNYEDALRQFYRNEYLIMFERMATWPEDVQRFCRERVNDVRALEMELKPRRRSHSPLS
ncbi:MAG: DUF2239 family protein [Saccharospirillum sp.]